MITPCPPSACIGGALPSRLDAVRQALAKAGERAQGAVLASDAFFLFPDGVEVAARAGVTAVVQPGSSVHDQDVIKAANRAGVRDVLYRSAPLSALSALDPKQRRADNGMR